MWFSFWMLTVTVWFGVMGALPFCHKTSGSGRVSASRLGIPNGDTVRALLADCRRGMAADALDTRLAALMAALALLVMELRALLADAAALWNIWLIWARGPAKLPGSPAATPRACLPMESNVFVT